MLKEESTVFLSESIAVILLYFNTAACRMFAVKLLQSVLTLAMMLSRNGRSSLGGTLRALLLMEEMKEQPVVNMFPPGCEQHEGRDKTSC